MKKIKYILAAGLATLMFTGCLSEYQNLNTDPEQLGNADPRNVFTGATENFNNSSRDHLLGKYRGTMIYMQYVVAQPMSSGSGGADAGYYISPSNPNNHPQPNGPHYSDYYGSFGLRLDYLINTVIEMQGDDAARYSDVQGVAKLLLAYKQWQILDTYGAAPITEAFKAQSEGIRTPRYDLYQASVDGTPMYKVLDDQVKAAVAQLSSSSNQYELGNNDYFYKGDIQKWIKFGNTFRVKMAQRLEKMDNAFYNSVISEVLTSPSNIIGSHEESLIYHHPNDYNNNTDDIQDITSRYCATVAFVDFMYNHKDPRMFIMLRPNGFGYGNNNATNDEWFETFENEYPDWAEQPQWARFARRYVGVTANPSLAADNKYNSTQYISEPYHLEDGSESNMDIRAYSQVESRYFIKNGGIRGNNNMPLRAIEDTDYIINQDQIDCINPILTYPETCFMVAEIALKSGSAVAGKDATTWYREGIKASMEQYRDWATDQYVVAQTAPTSPTYNPLTDAKIAEYLAQPEFQTATLEKIISQQWINLFRQPEEMWATWKRTGLPAFTGETPANGVAYFERILDTGVDLVIPRRNSLPTPNSMNMDNYRAAIEQLKGDAKYGTAEEKTEGRIWWDAQ